MKYLEPALSVCFGFALASTASAQSFNIDLDIGVGDAQGGNGAPSSGFGAAAGQPGFWNRITANGPHNLTSLQGLDGLPTGVQMQATGGIGGAGGYDFLGNTGDSRFFLTIALMLGILSIITSAVSGQAAIDCTPTL